MNLWDTIQLMISNYLDICRKGYWAVTLLYPLAHPVPKPGQNHSPCPSAEKQLKLSNHPTSYTSKQQRLASTPTLLDLKIPTSGLGYGSLIECMPGKLNTLSSIFSTGWWWAAGERERENEILDLVSCFLVVLFYLFLYSLNP
jgi:hypothetical protein